eukprot:8029563-Pyramimonas_sp.AAC.1
MIPINRSTNASAAIAFSAALACRSLDERLTPCEDGDSLSGASDVASDSGFVRLGSTGLSSRKGNGSSSVIRRMSCPMYQIALALQVMLKGGEWGRARPGHATS